MPPTRTAAEPPGPDALGALLVTGREDLVEEVAALAAATGVAVAVVADAAAAGRGWAGAALVMVGEDALAGGVPPCRGVVVVLRGGDETGETGGAGGAGGSGGDEGLWRAAVAAGARAVLTLPRERRALLDHLAALGEDAGPGARTVAVVGACGGLGSSSLAAALALSAARSTTALLVDADPLGGGLDLLLGLEGEPGLRWGDVAGARGSVRPAVLAQHLPRLGRAAVLSCSRGTPAVLDPEAVAVVLDAGRRGHGCVVLDLPRHVDGAGRVALQACDVLLLVTSAGVRGAASAQAVLAVAAPLVADVRLVVRAPAGRLRADPLALADDLGVPLGAVLAHDPSLVDAAERGQPPPVRGRGAAARACAALAGVLAGTPAPAAAPTVPSAGGRR